ncbi:MAG: hypothetical protein P8P74_01385 [Crocinitomicaceae bacterium]|nr:hypothetical protein [Crocinitomicaceae bacterium]
MKFQKPSYPYIVLLAILFTLAAVRTPNRGTNEITVAPADRTIATDAAASHTLISVYTNEEL